MKRRTALKLIRYVKKATKAIAVVDGVGWMILVTLLDSEPPIGDIVMKYFILTMAIFMSLSSADGDTRQNKKFPERWHVQGNK
nr:MAG TPA: hypothetical protein [Caudoviricetes sp.]